MVMDWINCSLWILWENIIKNDSQKCITSEGGVNHDGDSLDFGHYVSDIFDSSTGIWWHCDDDNITQISDLPKRVYYRETYKHMKKIYIMMAGSTDVFFDVYIRTSHLIKHSSNCFQEFTTMSKITHMKKVIEN